MCSSTKGTKCGVRSMASSREGSCEPSVLTRSIETLVREIEDVQSGLEQRLAVTPLEDFVLKEAATKDYLRDCYGRCFTAVGAISDKNQTLDNECRPILDELVKKNYHLIDVRDAYDSLIRAEENWGEFLQKFEKEWSKIDPPYMEGREFLQEGGNISPEHLALEFTSVVTKQIVSLKDVLARSRYTLFLFFRLIG